MSHASSPITDGVRPVADARPWYREIWFWVVFGLPLFAVGAGIAMVVIAVTHTDPVVVEDWYREGRAYNRHLELDRQAAQFGLSARVAAEGANVRLDLDSRVKLPTPETLTLFLRHPTLLEQDRQLDFARQPDGSYLATGTTLPEGEWHLTLAGANWRLVQRLRLSNGAAIRLGAASP